MISLLLGGSINQTAHASRDAHILNQNFEEKVERFFWTPENGITGRSNRSFEDFNIDESLARNSESITAQKEILFIPDSEIEAPVGYGFTEQGILVNKGNPEYKSSTYTEPGGYVTLLTRAYQIGFYDSNLVYKIESEAILNKNFYFTKTDSLIIRRGDNSAFFDGIVPVGTSTVKDIKRDTTRFNYMSEQELFAKGYRKYSGKDVDIFFNLDICIHSGNCVRGNNDVFNTKRRPWIIADNADVNEIKRVIHTCPSGALKYIVKNEEV